ncbi:MAG: GerAB/ArcD/ProY family transporter [Oscillospiraceae bacterium]|nr:GerAB/ArcD/ProY family transporter [Oscillospiraceae bacterium]
MNHNQIEPVSKISHFQLAALLMVSAIFTQITALPELSEHSMSKFITLSLSGVFLLALYTPLLIFTSRNSGNTLSYCNGSTPSKVIRWILGGIILLRLVYAVVLSLMQLKFAITKTVMPYLSLSFFMLLTLVTVFYGMSKGIQASARVAPISLFFLIIAIVAISFMMYDRIDVLRIYSPIWDNGMLGGGFKLALRNDELFLFAALSGFVNSKSPKTSKTSQTSKPNSYKAVLYYLPIVLVSGLWLNFLFNAVLGRFMPQILYPMYTIASFATFNVIERMDGVLVTAAIIAGLLKIILIFVCMRSIIACLLPPAKFKSAKTTVYVIGLVVFAATFFIVEDEPLLIADWWKYFFMVTMAATAIILPITGFIGRSKRKRETE